MINYFKHPIIDKKNIANSILTDIDISYINFIFHELFLEILNNNIENVASLNKSISLNLTDFDSKKADFVVKKILAILPQIFHDLNEIKDGQKYIRYLNMIENYLEYLHKFYGKNYLINNFLVNLNYQYLQSLYNLSTIDRHQEIIIIEKIFTKILNLVNGQIGDNFAITHNENHEVNCKLEYEKLTIFFLKITNNFQLFYCKNLNQIILFNFINKIIVNNSRSSSIRCDDVAKIITSYIQENCDFIFKHFNIQQIIAIITLINCFVNNKVAKSFFFDKKDLILSKIKLLDSLIANDFNNKSSKSNNCSNFQMEIKDFKLFLNKTNFNENSTINCSNFVIKKPENYNFYFNLFRQFDYIKNFIGIDFIQQNIVMSNYQSSEIINLLTNYIKFLVKKNVVSNLKLNNLFQVEMSFIYSCPENKKNYLLLINIDEISQHEKTLFYFQNQQKNNELIEKIITHYASEIPVIYYNLNLTTHYTHEQKLKKIIIDGGVNPSKQRLELVSKKLQEIFNDLIKDYKVKPIDYVKNHIILNNETNDFALEKVVSVRIFDGSVSRRLT